MLGEERHFVPLSSEDLPGFLALTQPFEASPADDENYCVMLVRGVETDLLGLFLWSISRCEDGRPEP